MNYTFFKQILGLFCLLLGVFALVTPFTPGSWLIFIGAEMLGVRLLTCSNVLLQYERVRVWFRERKEHRKE